LKFFLADTTPVLNIFPSSFAFERPGFQMQSDLLVIRFIAFFLPPVPSTKTHFSCNSFFLFSFLPLFDSRISPPNDYGFFPTQHLCHALPLPPALTTSACFVPPSLFSFPFKPNNCILCITSDRLFPIFSRRFELPPPFNSTVSCRCRPQAPPKAPAAARILSLTRLEVISLRLY